MTNYRSPVGLALLICISICTAGEFTIGQAVFLRSTGTPRTDTLVFAAPCLSCQYTLNLENGPDGTCRVSSAVWLNGTQVVFGTSDFNQQVARLQKQVTLSTLNLVTVCLRSGPGCAMKINVAGLENMPPSINIATPVKGSVTNSTRPRIVVTYSDYESGLDLTTLRINIDGIDHTGGFSVGTDSAACPSITPLTDGEITVIAAISDRAGNSARDTLRFFVDTKPPVVQILSPIAGFLTTISRVVVDWVVDGVHQVTQTFENLAEGVNAIVRTATDAAGNIGADTVEVAAICDEDGVCVSDTSSFTVDYPPEIEIYSPSSDTLVNETTISVSYFADREMATRVFEIAEGENVLVVDTLDSRGRRAADTLRVVCDLTPPVVTITSPSDGSATNQPSIEVEWEVDGVVQTASNVEDLCCEGGNHIERWACDEAGNCGSAAVTVFLDTQAPVVRITSPADAFCTNQRTVAVSWTVDGVPQDSQNVQELQEGENVIVRSATDHGGAGADTARVMLDTKPPVVEIVSPVDGTVTNQLWTSVAWTVDGVARTTQLYEKLVLGLNLIIRSATDAGGN